MSCLKAHCMRTRIVKEKWSTRGSVQICWKWSKLIRLYWFVNVRRRCLFGGVGTLWQCTWTLFASPGPFQKFLLCFCFVIGCLKAPQHMWQRIVRNERYHPFFMSVYWNYREGSVLKLSRVERILSRCTPLLIVPSLTWLLWSNPVGDVEPPRAPYVFAARWCHLQATIKPVHTYVYTIHIFICFHTYIYAWRLYAYIYLYTLWERERQRDSFAYIMVGIQRSFDIPICIYMHECYMRTHIYIYKDKERERDVRIRMSWLVFTSRLTYPVSLHDTTGFASRCQHHTCKPIFPAQNMPVSRCVRTLQHSATLVNALQHTWHVSPERNLASTHTVTSCNTLRHTATQVTWTHLDEHTQYKVLFP